MSLPTPALPSNSGAFTIRGGPFQCALPTTVDSDEESRSGVSYLQDVPGVDGEIRTRNSKLAGITLSITGVIQDAATVQDFKRVVGQKRVVVERDGLTLTGDVTTYRIKEVNTNAVWEFTLTVDSAEHYWSGSNIESAGSVVSTGFDSGVFNTVVEVVNPGDLTVLPTIRVVGPSGGLTSVKVEALNGVAEYVGPVGQGEVLLMRCFNVTADLDGVGVLSAMQPEFFTNPPRLTPGLNTVVITSAVDGSTEPVVDFSFGGRFL